ncbi:hypothetical protein [Trueperella pyogenes]|uniref:hypothetical protein n=1 Tax=Trueperella pyogenes TaxID=1661 RepID=UPI0010125F9B|nr:hypothetical protein [Trueperella pyogenes]
MSDKGDFFVVRKGATAVPNSLIHNKDLSYQALALALVSLSMPAGAKVGYRQLKGRGLGEAATRKALLELEEHHLRFRFRTRHEGKIRDVTVVSDVPLTVGQARAEIVQRVSNQALSSREVLACVSHPGEDAGIEQVAPQDALPEIAAEAVTMSATSAQETSADPVDNYRAVTGTARCDQHKRLPVDNCGGQSADLHECNVSAGRTVPRSTVARSAEAHITKVISKSSLRSDNSNQTSAGRVVGDGVVWAALPEVWWGWLGRSACERVVQVVQAGLSAGWTPEAIRARLAGNALPPRDQVRNLEGLIISRVRGVVSDPAPVVVEVDPREHAQRRLEVCHQILAGTCSLSAREQVTVANSAVNDPLLRAEAELTLEAFYVASSRYGRDEQSHHRSSLGSDAKTYQGSGHVRPQSARADDGNSNECGRFSPPSGEGAKHMRGTSVSPLKGKFHATKRN